jgi:hypothetical protein
MLATTASIEERKSVLGLVMPLLRLHHLGSGKQKKLPVRLIHSG